MSCSICSSQNLKAMDDALSGGMSVRAAQTKFGLSKSAIARHRQNCLAPKVAAAARIMTPSQGEGDVKRAKEILQGAAPAATDVLTLTGHLERIARSLDRLEGAADSAAADKLHAALAAVSGQLHRGVETAAKLQGFYADPATSTDSKFSISIVIPEVGARPLPNNITPSHGAASVGSDRGGTRDLSRGFKINFHGPQGPEE